jgi:hypothetical protein
MANDEALLNLTTKVTTTEGTTTAITTISLNVATGQTSTLMDTTTNFTPNATNATNTTQPWWATVAKIATSTTTAPPPPPPIVVYISPPPAATDDGLKGILTLIGEIAGGLSPLVPIFGCLYRNRAAIKQKLLEYRDRIRNRIRNRMRGGRSIEVDLEIGEEVHQRPTLYEDRGVQGGGTRENPRFSAVVPATTIGVRKVTFGGDDFVRVESDAEVIDWEVPGAEERNDLERRRSQVSSSSSVGGRRPSQYPTSSATAVDSDEERTDFQRRRSEMFRSSVGGRRPSQYPKSVDNESESKEPEPLSDAPVRQRSVRTLPQAPAATWSDEPPQQRRRWGWLPPQPQLQQAESGDDNVVAASQRFVPVTEGGGGGAPPRPSDWSDQPGHRFTPAPRDPGHVGLEYSFRPTYKGVLGVPTTSVPAFVGGSRVDDMLGQMSNFPGKMSQNQIADMIDKYKIRLNVQGRRFVITQLEQIFRERDILTRQSLFDRMKQTIQDFIMPDSTEYSTRGSSSWQ